jgi:hypothetical protein
LNALSPLLFGPLHSVNKASPFFPYRERKRLGLRRLPLAGKKGRKRKRKEKEKKKKRKRKTFALLKALYTSDRVPEFSPLLIAGSTNLFMHSAISKKASDVARRFSVKK